MPSRDESHPAGPVDSARSRIGIPRTAERLVTREPLLRRLDRLAPLSVIRGLVGSGKTTLAAQWARRQQAAGAQVVWLTVTAERTDPVALMADISEALGAHGLSGHGLSGPACGEDSTAGWDPERWAETTAASLNAVDQRIILVVDEAHRADDTAVGIALCALLMRTARTYAVVSTRIVHPVEEQARRSGLDITALSGRDLSADTDELITIAAAWGHEISRQRAGQIHATVGGWLAAIQRVLDDTPAADPQLSTGSAREYFRTRVLPTVIDRVLLEQASHLAVADEIDEVIAAAVLAVLPGGRSAASAAAIMGRCAGFGLLERAASTADHPVWRFPALVRAVLADSLTVSDPAGARRTHRVIAAHLAASPRRDEHVGRIMRHARAGEDWALLEKVWALHGVHVTLTCPDAVIEAFENLPEAAVASHPVLAFGESTVACMRDPAGVAEQLNAVRGFVDSRWSTLTDGTVFASRDAHLLTVTAGLVAHRARGTYSAGLAMAADFDRRLREDTEAGGLPVAPANAAWFELQWAVTALLAGDMVRARDTAVRAFTRGQAAGSDFVCAQSSALTALIDAMSGHGRQARTWLEIHRRYDLTGTWVHRIVTLPAELAELMRALDSLDGQAAAAGRSAAESGTDAIELWPHQAWVATQDALLYGDPRAMLTRLGLAVSTHPHTHAHGAARQLRNRCAADLLLALGELNRAKRLLDGDVVEAVLAVPRARLALITGDAEAARATASATVWNDTTSPRDQAELLMIKAAASLAMGDAEAAATVFAHAHALAVDQQTLIPYLGIPAGARRRLFALCPELRLPDEQTASIEAARVIYPEAGELILLTEREHVVLAALVDNRTLSDVAKALTVSVHTVKKQALSVYAKLGVHDRAAALQQAHRLGLLPEASRRS